MIPVEYFWIALICVFGIVGMARGLWRELGVTTVLLLSLFALTVAWDQIGARIVEAIPGGAPSEIVKAAYYAITILFVAYIAYEGFSLKFPIKEMKGIAKAILGLPGGLLNGYLIMGTIWDVTNEAGYFGVEVPMGSSGQMIEISNTLSELHNTLVQYLPITFISPFVMLILGMILLLAIILK
jgi:uncharacterized membrane protein required for colicin V production